MKNKYVFCNIPDKGGVDWNGTVGNFLNLLGEGYKIISAVGTGIGSVQYILEKKGNNVSE